jgi:phosphoribosylanthranilate isomerase
MMVKICGITNREDALVSIEGGAAALGFNFFPESPRYLEPARAREIAAVVPAGIWKVGVFVNEAPEEALRIAEETGMDILQIHGNAVSFPEGIRLWQGVRVDAEFRPEQLDSPNAEAFLLDAASSTLHGGTGMAFDWKVARGLPQKVIVAGGLDETNVRQAIEEAQPWGVDACSRLEAAPGRKDHLKLTKFLKAALA